jgi:multimeric flavodoxin WrbA
MKVLLVNGSPHKNGCTFTALNEVAESLQREGVETEIFWIGNRPIGGCINCQTCAKKHRCVFDDKVNEFLDKAKDYDGFVFGSPVHWASAGGAITSFLDRVFYADLCGELNTFRLKPAAAVVNARRAGTTATWDQLNKYFGLMQMPIISSRYWNMTHGFTPEEVRKDLEGMQTMRVLGKNMAFFLKCKDMAMKAGLQLPDAEEPIYTNFIRE